MVAYGGGKDSSYTLAFVRAMQLILFRVHGSTFQLRVATNRHAGMPRAVLENVDANIGRCGCSRTRTASCCWSTATR